MYRHAANSAAQPNSSLNAPSVLIPSFGRHNEHRSMPSSREALTRREMGCGLDELLPPRSEELTSVH